MKQKEFDDKLTNMILRKVHVIQNAFKRKKSDARNNYFLLDKYLLDFFPNDREEMIHLSFPGTYPATITVSIYIRNLWH